ncbi:hypothetical protein [uncultured Tateyamaria sp.]|uniref:hypothetical protein n=1 Tax=Tateyamaria sp. 1078 TaxID=3417464 RepID=UPI00261749C0|nr:hypothetical protein [uncultured Tateyamaria sp.]
MKTVLHIGAHRTGTTTFQTYLSRNRTALQAQGIACWGPWITRKGLFAGIQQPTPMARRSAMGRARGRLALRRHMVQQDLGAQTLVVSEENIMGSMVRNLRHGKLYDDVGERLARFIAAFDGDVHTVVVGIRALDHYWASLAAHSVVRGYSVPDRDCLSHICAARRTWRDVISDIACAAPDARIQVLPFERFAGQPDAQLSAILGRRAPQDAVSDWRNRRPNLAQLRAVLAERGERPDMLNGPGERWNPFFRAEVSALREAYADDMFWLTAGASGLATLTEDLDRTEAEWPVDPLTRGHYDDIKERRMAQPR